MESVSDESAFDSIDHYLNERIRRDPSAELVLAVIRPASRAVMRVLIVFKGELLDLLLNSREPAVAQVRLRWWAEEWRRLVDGEPRHPLTRAMLELDRSGEIHQRDLVDGLSGVGQVLLGEEGQSIGAVSQALGSAVSNVEAALVGDQGDHGDRDDVSWEQAMHWSLLSGVNRLDSLGVTWLPVDLAAEIQHTRADLMRDSAALDAVRLRIALNHVKARSRETTTHGGVYLAAHSRWFHRLWEGGRPPAPLRLLFPVWNAARRLSSPAQAD